MPNDCKDNCPVLPRVEALEEANKQHTQTHREIFKRLKDTELDTAVQQKHMESIDRTMTEIKDDQKIILKKVEAIEGKPGERWETLVKCVISAGGGAFLIWVAMGMPGVG